VRGAILQADEAEYLSQAQDLKSVVANRQSGFSTFLQDNREQSVAGLGLVVQIALELRCHCLPIKEATIKGSHDFGVPRDKPKTVTIDQLHGTQGKTGRLERGFVVFGHKQPAATGLWGRPPGGARYPSLVLLQGAGGCSFWWRLISEPNFVKSGVANELSHSHTNIS